MSTCMTTANGAECATTDATPMQWTTPRADVLHNGEETILRLDLPGITKDQLSINVEKSILTVEAVFAAGNPDDRFLHREFAPTGFRRRFELSDELDTANIRAELTAGVLTLTIPKLAAAKPRKITVIVD